MFCTQLGPLESPDLRYAKSPGALHIHNLPKKCEWYSARENTRREIILTPIFHIFCHLYHRSKQESYPYEESQLYESPFWFTNNM